MPSKLSPGTPSMLAGSRMPCQWIDVWLPWIEPGGRALRTRRVTVVPARQRSSGAGIEPLTVIAGRVAPAKFIGVSPMVRSKSVPESTLGTPAAWTAQLERGHRPRAAPAPAAGRPVTEWRRDGADSPSARPKRSDDMETPGKVEGSRGERYPVGAEQRTGSISALKGAQRHLADRRSEEIGQCSGRVHRQERFGSLPVPDGEVGECRLGECCRTMMHARTAVVRLTAVVQRR